MLIALERIAAVTISDPCVDDKAEFIEHQQARDDAAAEIDGDDGLAGHANELRKHAAQPVSAEPHLLHLLVARNALDRDIDGPAKDDREDEEEGGRGAQVKLRQAAEHQPAEQQREEDQEHQKDEDG